MKEAIIDYLKAMKLNASRTYVEKRLLSHPDYPSILSVSDVMEQMGLKVQVGKIGKEYLPDIPMPFLVHTQANNSFLLVDNEQTLINLRENLQAKEGVILKADKAEKISDPANEIAYKADKLNTWTKNTALAGLVFLLGLSFFPAISFVNSVFLITALSGLVLGYVLIAKDLGESTPEADCSFSGLNWFLQI
jgi:ABC-type bacteriocin/lantibiotic exporter with double-glycine peptidase domain